MAMDFEDITLYYKEMALFKRLTLLCLLALAPAACDFMDRWQTLDAQNKEIQAEVLRQEAEKNKSLEKHRQIRKLEEQLSAYEVKLKEESKVLPDEVLMDQVLKTTELIAQDLGLSLQAFKPGTEIPSESAFKYLKLPVSLQVVGTYGQIATFIDRIVHMDTILEIENIKLEAANSPNDDSAKPDDTQNEIAAQRKRSQMRLAASFDLMIFRSMTERESAAMDKYMQEQNKAKNPQAPEAPKVTESVQN